MTIHLYADGGVILKNPSAIGGTWAWRRVWGVGTTMEDKNPPSESGVITPSLAHMPAITNNLTEMLALLYGIEWLSPAARDVHVLSDSQNALGRLFWGWKWSNIPEWMHEIYRAQRARLIYWETFKITLLDGHPTKAQLAAGIGKRGNPVSIHNVWCDQACRDQAERFMASHAQ